MSAIRSGFEGLLLQELAPTALQAAYTKDEVHTAAYTCTHTLLLAHTTLVYTGLHTLHTPLAQLALLEDAGCTPVPCYTIAWLP